MAAFMIRIVRLPSDSMANVARWPYDAILHAWWAEPERLLAGEYRLSWLERFLSLHPVHAVAGTIRTADLILRHRSTPDMSGLRREALLPTPVNIRPLRHPSHPRAWGWRAIQSELFDGVS
jgi:hypothetical protein